MPIEGSKAGADEKSRDLFLRMRWLSPAQQQKFLADLNNDQLSSLLAYLYDGGEKDPRVTSARDMATRAAKGRGISVDEARKSKAPKEGGKGKSGGGKSGTGGGGKSGGSKGKSSGGGKSSGSGSSKKKSSGSSSGSSGSSNKKKTTSSTSGTGSTAKPKPPTAPGPPSRRVAAPPGDGGRATPGVPKK